MMLPGIGRPEAARRHEADAGHALVGLVELGREPDQIVIGLDGVLGIDIAAGHFLESIWADMDHLDVAVERNAVETLAAPIAVVELVGVVEIIDRQFPLGGIVIELGEEARSGEIAKPGREELQRIEAGIAGNEFGDDLVAKQNTMLVIVSAQSFVND